ncbi:MAG: beta-lactam-binding protein with PASTA domain [Saprospiraceae bacterium]|jgi:beta-lactam-binding protein with PASTA domain
MGFIKFIFSKSFVFNLVIATVLLVVGYFLLDNFLSSYTRKGEELPVPDVTSVHIDELPELLEKNGFRFELLDSIWDRTKHKGTVTEQRPKAGQLVKPGRKVYITFYARSNKKIKLYLENILGGTVRAAMDNLQSMDVLVDSIEYKDFQYDDIVLGIKNSKGKKLKNDEIIDAGAKLILLVGQTGRTTVKVPKVIGKTLHEAKNEIIANNLNVSVAGMPYHTCGDKIDSTVAIIKRQTPGPFKEIKTGSSVTLFYDCDTIKP